MECNRIYSPKCAIFGYECLKEVGKEIISLNVKKALIVTDDSMIKNGIETKVENMLRSFNIDFAVFDKVKPNPTVEVVEDGLKILNENDCDFCISIGGGSAHDSAKAICIVATNKGSILDYKGVDKSKIAPLPLVAINTTAGTASEYTAAFVIVDEKTGTKFGARDKNVIASIAVDDWSLMMNLPKKLTAGTGMDALTHAIEAYTSVHGFEMTKVIALAAIKEIFSSLLSAFDNPNKDNREKMAIGQYLAGMAFGNAGCGLVHSMSHQLSAIYNLPHGLSNAILLPTVMEYNMKSIDGIKEYAEIAKEVFPYDVMNMNDKEKAYFLIEKIRKLSADIEIPVDLKTFNVREEDVDLLAEKAMQDSSLPHNIKKPSLDDIKQLYLKLI